MKKYDVWYNNKICKDWFLISEFVSLKEAENTIKDQLKDSQFFSVNASLFKICNHSDKSWMKYIPTYLLNK